MQEKELEMDMNSLGGGLAALAFWGFLAAVVVGGIWYGLRERQAQYDTLSRMIESGKPVDQAVVDKILGGNVRPDRGLKIAGLITLFVAPGLVVLGWALGKVEDGVLQPLLGVAGLVAFVGVGLLVAGKFAERSLKEDEASRLN
jgi:hypothetical protein